MKALHVPIFLVLLAIAFTSCEKVIDLELKDAAPQLVIEGGISNAPQILTVKISRTVPFDQPNAFPGVSGATVRLTSGTTTLNFAETSKGVYQVGPVSGRSGRSYNLQVDVEGQTYKATSTMPTQVLIDSIAIDEDGFRGRDKKTMVVYLKDPSNQKNQYRFLMKVNDVLIKQVFTRNDEFSNGNVIRVPLFQDDVEIKTGDRIDIEMQCIDEANYTYWFTFSKQSGNAQGNASVSPTNPPNNFDKPVLGYFSAYTTDRRIVNIK
ncbi:DUF4249 domain-containing protein [Mucilaginibacter auburnensis]|uniref:Uncharacterized protein DUF4249 n=1 Tax=Mucilaginibacter auburnensis TaxID=1457233 RepID=A0A2H9VRX0_9SPHI|nr:DUF4249 domain-containing protein [Mucilaginibacter auburnensis]PJJ83564.1 uncharacterized protein DUF4249 [Mucilaginibacter auburnensis]